MNSRQIVRPPSLPSNLAKDQEQEVIFNSIGFYGDLLGRLDGQINMTEELYEDSFYKIKEKNNLDQINHFLSQSDAQVPQSSVPQQPHY